MQNVFLLASPCRHLTSLGVKDDMQPAHWERFFVDDISCAAGKLATIKIQEIELTAGCCMINTRGG